MTSDHLERNLDFILSSAQALAKLREELRQTTTGLGILFIDLVGSTDLKHRSTQEDWLPVVARFLIAASRTINEQGGTVVKYIGDEVMAVFPESNVGLTSLRMESCLWNLEEQLNRDEPRSYAKYAFDYGEAAEISFEGFPRDYLGSAVDRCARIAKFAKKGTALASNSYVTQSKNPRSWRRIGQVDLPRVPQKRNHLSA
jgi:adenylate cyclase